MAMLREFWGSLTPQGRTMVVLGTLATLGILLSVAMYFGYDLAWIPGILTRLSGS